MDRRLADAAPSLPASPGNVDELSEAVLHASRAKDFRYDLQLQARGPIVAQGQGGYSVKSAAGQASYYYSQPFYTVEGMLALPEGEIAVTGQAWLDREWSSQPLAADQTGWDWFSLHFDFGEKLMGFLSRDGATAAKATRPLPGFQRMESLRRWLRENSR